MTNPRLFKITDKDLNPEAAHQAEAQGADIGMKIKFMTEDSSNGIWQLTEDETKTLISIAADIIKREGHKAGRRTYFDLSAYGLEGTRLEGFGLLLTGTRSNGIFKYTAVFEKGHKTLKIHFIVPTE